MLLKNLCDSHVHFTATGQVASEINLSTLTSLEELGKFRAHSSSRRGPWLVGFGWDENKFPDRKSPTVADMDRLFPDEPVYFSRCDGHSGVINSVGMKILGISSMQFPEGILREMDHDKVLSSLPGHSEAQVTGFMKTAMDLFHRQGFTHLREMGGNLRDWKIARSLEEKKEFHLQMDWNFVCTHLSDFSRCKKEILEARGEESPRNRVLGVKIYFDGSLGSETALLSSPYAHRCDHHKGIACWPEADVKELLRQAWTEGFDVAVHAIGDAAVDKMVDLAREVSAMGIAGHLHLEHAEVIRPETIQKMKPIHITCHLQPCHWLSDRQWLKEKLGPLAVHAFPWEALRKARIPFRFGSDSPIEAPSLWNNLQALEESAKMKIPALQDDPFKYHVHPRPSVHAETLFEGREVREIKFNGDIVFSAGS